nr:hypothetical protein CFP56_69166 [Quercus suber]
MTCFERGSNSTSKMKSWEAVEIYVDLYPTHNEIDIDDLLSRGRDHKHTRMDRILDDDDGGCAWAYKERLLLIASTRCRAEKHCLPRWSRSSICVRSLSASSPS